ncbi:MAG TPA: aminotransferase class V-fold PLP-dependent enzyme [Kofleriaceae bacterium]|jgi:selenocysteine lyase/cysteine desulfurase|nr:aminotransferase class V-fold PLP-dependent enzyme [Kofleriaceae bacterium]
MTTDRRAFLGSLGVLSAYACAPAAPTSRPRGPRGLIASDDFAFDPELAYLQTGSLGPSPRPVVERALAVWKQLEGNPSMHGYGELQKGMEVVRGKAAALLGCKLDELVLTNCTTEGMNWVAQGLSLAQGDRILTTDQEHPGGRVGWDFVAKRYGAAIDVVAIPPGENDAGVIVERFTKAITPRTVALSFSHVLSSTGLRMPVAELSALARKANAIAIVDGAQAVGAIPVDVKALGCHVYATSGHKWLLGPPGTGMLYLSSELGDRVAVIALADGRAAYSHSSGVCSIPSVHGLGAAIDYMTSIGIARVEAYDLELHRHAHERLSALPKLRVVSPAGGPLASPMLTYILPAGIDAGELGGRLFRNHHIEVKLVPPSWLNGHRVSTHIFNHTDDVDRLADALEVELGRT